MLLRAPTCSADHTGGMGFIDHGQQTVTVRKLHQSRQIYDITVHTEHAVTYNHTISPGVSLDLFFQIRHVIVAIDDQIRLRQAAPVNNAGVVQLITVDDIPFPRQR